MFEHFSDAGALDAFLKSHLIYALYFSAPSCAVCDGLKPKLIAMLTQRFPRIGIGEVDCSLSPSLAAGYSVFTVPSLLVFTEGKDREYLRGTSSFALIGVHLRFRLATTAIR